jgi:hypothetical protein
MITFARKMFWPSILFLASLLFVQAHAMAADITSAASTRATQAQSLAALLPMLGLAVASILSYGLRWVSAKYDFFHNGFGKAIITILGSTITTITPVLQAGTFTWIALAWAAVGAVSSFAATLSPSMAAVKQQPTPNIQQQQPLPLALLPILLIPALLISGCAVCTNVDNSTCARKVLVAADTVDGVAARTATSWIRACADGARSLRDANRLDEANKAYTVCEKTGNLMVLAVKEVESTAQAASDGIDVEEAAHEKNYVGVLSPLYDSIKMLYKIFNDAGAKLPSSLAAMFGAQ